MQRCGRDGEAEDAEAGEDHRSQGHVFIQNKKSNNPLRLWPQGTGGSLLAPGSFQASAVTSGFSSWSSEDVSGPDGVAAWARAVASP